MLVSQSDLEVGTRRTWPVNPLSRSCQVKDKEKLGVCYQEDNLKIDTNLQEQVMVDKADTDFDLIIKLPHHFQLLLLLKLLLLIPNLIYMLIRLWRIMDLISVISLD